MRFSCTLIVPLPRNNHTLCIENYQSKGAEYCCFGYKVLDFGRKIAKI